MRKASFFLKLILASVLSLVSISVSAEETGANRDTVNIFIQDTHQMPTAHAFLLETPSDSVGQKLFNAHIRDKGVTLDSSVADIPSSRFRCPQTELLQRAAGFAQYIFSFNPRIAEEKYYYLLDIFTFINLNNLRLSHSPVTGDISASTKSYALLKMPDSFDIDDDLRLTPEHWANYDRNSEKPATLAPYYDPALKPFIHNPFHDTAISIYLPISVSRSLTIAPAITYAFSTNNTNNQEFKGKGLVNNLIDKDSAIVYGGIHFKYSF